MAHKYFYSTKTLSPTIKHILTGGAIGEKASVKGWVRSLRKQKNICFANITDGTNLQGIQVILNESQLNK